MFGIDDIKLESEEEVIVISETTEKISIDEGPRYDAGEDNEEVNSPFVMPPTNVRRKLFVETEDPDDRQSTTEKCIVFVDVGEDVQVITRVDKGRKLTKKLRTKPDSAGPSAFSPRGSSCASNSPIGSTARLHK